MTLLGAFDPHPVRLSNPEGASAFLLVADHAGRRRPRALGDLGVRPADWDRHVAYDIGIEAVGACLARALDAPLIEQRYSRLVIDCNRPPGHPDSIPARSETVEIPANATLDDAGRSEREKEILQPYRLAVAAALDRRARAGRRTVLVALHSFTPHYLGAAGALAENRPWHAAILHDDGHAPAPDPLARRMLRLLAAEPGLLVGDNQPYRLTATSDYTIPHHAWSRGLDHVEIEIRQDLIANEAGHAEWSARLARLLRAADEGREMR